jgi:outer membrane protein TolC
MFGVQINQIASSHPGSLLIPGLRSTGQGTEGILIARIRYDQQRAEFDRLINQQLLNVESAYWDLYAAYYNLYAQEEILRQSYDLLSVLQKRLDAGTISQQDLTQSRAQYWQFRQQVSAGRQQVLESEQQLRGLMGMNTATAPDRLVPIDEPNLAPFEPDFYMVATDSLSFRPDLILARQDLKFRQLDLILSKNLRRPDLRFFATYDIQGIGTRLDGAPTEQVQGTNPQTGLPQSQTVPQNALDSLMDNKFNSWQLGLRLDMPLGFRDANAAVRQGQLNLVRSYWQLHDAERKVMETVLQQWRLVPFRHNQIELVRMQRLDLQRTLELNKQLIEGGTWNVNTLFNVLQVQQNTAAAIANEFQNVAEYNKALCSLEWAKGTIQRYNNVSVGEGVLPAHVSKKAADHFRAREIGLKIRQHPAAVAASEYSDAVYKTLNAGDKPSATMKPGELPILPAMPAPTPPNGEKLPTPKPLPAGEKEKEKVSYIPGEPAPTTIRPFPTEPTMPTIPTIPAVPAAGTASEVLPTFRAVDTIKIPARTGGGTPVDGSK